MFQTFPESLKGLLDKAHTGQLQLPDFQRSYVWGDEDVQNIIASVAKGYPIGAFLSLQAGGEVKFKPRPLEGIDMREIRHSSPSELLLDGQQRLTSLYQSIYSKAPVRTLNSRGKEIDRLYYIDIHQAIDAGADIQDAIIGVPADRILRKNFGRDVDVDLSTRENEFERHSFPLNQIFPFPQDWLIGWQSYWRERGKDVFDWMRDFQLGIVNQIHGYAIPVIQLGKQNGREAICLIFEKVNTGGKPLNTFELLTAIYAADEFDLREDWDGPLDDHALGRRQRIYGTPNPIDVLSGVSEIDFLQACTLLHTLEERLAKERDGAEGRNLPQVSCSRDALLRLPLEAYRKYADSVESGFRDAASFLHEQKIISKRDVPYAPLTVGLATTFAILRGEGRIISVMDKDKIKAWFWSMTLGEMYGSRTESLLARDVPELVRWVTDTGPKPRTMDESIFQQDRLLSLTTRRSAAYKGIHALLMGHKYGGCRDFITGKTTGVMTFFNDEIHMHHVFPQAWCKKMGIPAKDFDSIVNKSPLSKASNLFISGDAPSSYLKRIEQKHDLPSGELDDILRTHLIEPRHLRDDDFYAFFNARIDALADTVSDAMYKPVVKEHGANEEERNSKEPQRDDDGDTATIGLIDLIEGGESTTVEFKSTLRTNLHTNKQDKEIEHEVLKTLAGFLNTDGGTLVIGVADDGTPVGIEADKFPSEDKMYLHLVNIMKSRTDSKL